MATGKRKDALARALELVDRQQAQTKDPTKARSAERRMMTVAERVAFADYIRSQSKPTDEDSTDLIRRDRDER